MSDYVAFFLNTQSSVIALDCIEISHPSFASTLYFVRNVPDGIALMHEDNSSHYYTYQPMKIDRSNVSNDLEQTMQITLADLDDSFINAIKNIRHSAYPRVKPKIKYRLYRDDDLSSPVMSLQTLEIANVSKDKSGNVSFEAKAPELNSVKTGEVYGVERFPMLRGTL